MSGYDYNRWDYGDYYRRNDTLWDIMWADRVVADTQKRLPYIKDAQLQQEMEKSIAESKETIDRYYAYYCMKSSNTHHVIPDSKDTWMETLRRVYASRV